MVSLFFRRRVASAFAWCVLLTLAMAGSCARAQLSDGCGKGESLCNDPPAPICADESMLTTYVTPGVCEVSICTYASTQKFCPKGCKDGACRADPCRGPTCNTPPLPSCVNDTTARTFVSPGQCIGGVCEYTETLVPCTTSEVCAKGRCAWNDASLLSLAVSQGSLAFAPETTSYAVSVPAGTTTLSVTATVSMPARVTLQVNGNPVDSGVAAWVALAAVTNTITVRVQAESGVTREYDLVITVM